MYHETGVILTGISVYAYNTKNDEAAEIQNRVQQIVMSHDWALQMHGFHVDTADKVMRFDVVMSFDVEPKTGLEEITAEIREVYPDYTVRITPDTDLSD